MDGQAGGGPKSRRSGTMDATRPRIPFAEWPLQAVLSAGFVWYTAPGVLVTQAQVEHASLEHTRAMTVLVDAVLKAKADDLAALGGLLIIHDWRTVKSWDPEVRQHLVQRAKDRPAGLVRGIEVAMPLNPIMRMAAQVIDLMMSAVGGGRVKVIDSLPESLVRHRVKTPPTGARLPTEIPTPRT